jgi:glycerol-3-phosphate O-acyltransferase
VVNYGVPIHLSQWLEENQLSLDLDDADARRETVKQLGEDLSQAIHGLIPVMPVSLLAHVLLEQESGISEWQLKSAAMALGERIGAAGFCVAIEDNEEDRAFTLGIYRLTKRRLVEVDASGSLRVNSNATAVLEYYANSLPKTGVT